MVKDQAHLVAQCIYTVVILNLDTLCMLQFIFAIATNNPFTKLTAWLKAKAWRKAQGRKMGSSNRIKWHQPRTTSWFWVRNWHWLGGRQPQDGAKLKCKSRGDKKIINRKMFYIVTMVIFLHSLSAFHTLAEGIFSFAMH